jgi:hypothetical protein
MPAADRKRVRRGADGKRAGAGGAIESSGFGARGSTRVPFALWVTTAMRSFEFAGVVVSVTSSPPTRRTPLSAATGTSPDDVLDSATALPM